MRTILAILLFAASACAQGAPPAKATAAVGVCSTLPNTIFEVKTENGERAAQPAAGKALVYFLQDDTRYLEHPRPTTRLAVDGAWVGATHSDRAGRASSVCELARPVCSRWWQLLPCISPRLPDIPTIFGRKTVR